MDFPTERQRASLRSRFAARAVDGLAALAAFIVTAIMFPRLPFLPMVAGGGYWLFCDAFQHGQSAGKRLLNIRVVDGARAQSCTIPQALARNLFLAWLWPLEIFALITDRTQRFGDRLANTFVVRLVPLPVELPERPLRPTHLQGAVKPHSGPPES